MKKFFNFLGGFLRSKTNESVKRIIAVIFSITLVVVYFFTNDIEVKKLLIYVYGLLIALLLGLATIENIVDIFKNKNN